MRKSFLTAVLSLTLVGGAFFGGAALTLGLPAVAAPQKTLSLDPKALEARAAILYDLVTGRVLYQKNAQEPLPLASLTKLITAQTVLDARNPSTLVRITSADLSPEGDWGLRPGDILSLADLLRLGLVASSNDAAAAAAGSLGSGYVEDLNKTAKDLALTRTRFYNATGLDLDSETAGAYGSAFDVARLAAAFYRDHPSFFGLTRDPAVTVDDNGRFLSYDATMAPLQNLPGFIAAKTGYTDLAGGNLAAIVDLSIGRPAVAVVLHSSESGRFTDVRTLVESAREQDLP